MPITTLDPVTALVVIDLQKGVVGLPGVHAMSGVVANAVALARTFRARGLPVALVNVAGASPGRTDLKRPPMVRPPGWTDLIPELEQAESDILVTKYTQGAFHATALDLHLRRRGTTQIVLCGVATGSGVEATARQAFEHGYNVTFAADAMTDASPDAHKHSIEHLFPKLGEVGSTADILKMLP
ncbi:MAG: isochorismatase family protein [Polyangiaceae bacterium]|nr:isochorismatase family protein [Polyangiaceae bacterium]